MKEGYRVEDFGGSDCDHILVENYRLLNTVQFLRHYAGSYPIEEYATRHTVAIFRIKYKPKFQVGEAFQKTNKSTNQ